MDRISKSTIFIYFISAFLAGIFLSAQFAPLKKNFLTGSAVLIIGIIALALFAIFVFGILPRQKIIFLWLLFIIASIAAGGFYYDFFVNNFIKNDYIGNLAKSGRQVKLSGVIDGEIEQRGTLTVFIIKPDGIRTKLLIAVKNPHFWYGYGDRVLVEGKITFIDSPYALKKGAAAAINYPKIEILNHNNGNFLKAFLFKIKENLSGYVAKIYPEPIASFAEGIILGQDKNFSGDFKEKMRLTGTTHLVALSGYNITVISQFLMLVFLALGISRSRAFWLSAAGIVMFVIMTGASASVVRAGIMGILVLLACKTGKMYNVSLSLAAAAFLMVLLNPTVLCFDAGFILSFLATLGLVCLAPFLGNKFSANSDREKFAVGIKGNSFILKIKSIFAGAFITTASAQIMVLGFLLFKFKTLSFVSIAANLLILPVVPFAMLAVFLSAVLGFFSIVLAKLLGFMSMGIVAYGVFIIEKFSQIPYAAVTIDNFSWPFVIIYYLLLFGFILYLKKRQREKLNKDLFI